MALLHSKTAVVQSLNRHNTDVMVKGCCPTFIDAVAGASMTKSSTVDNFADWPSSEAKYSTAVGSGGSV